MRSRSLRLRGIPSTCHQQLARVRHGHRHLVELQHVERLAVAVHPPRPHRLARPSAFPLVEPERPGRSGPCRHRPHPVDQAIDGVVEQVGEVGAGEVRQHVVELGPVGRASTGRASRRWRRPPGAGVSRPSGRASSSTTAPSTVWGTQRRAAASAAPSRPARRRMRASTATASSSAGWNVPWLGHLEHERRVGPHVVAQRPAPGRAAGCPSGRPLGTWASHSRSACAAARATSSSRLRTWV